MLEIFNGIFEDGTEASLVLWKFLLCIFVSLLTGVLYAWVSGMKKGKFKPSASFKTATAFLPAAVCAVIMMVNGNVGAGVAVAGAFSLIRFRSAQGSATEICIIFMAMCSGLIAGVGYLAYAVTFTIIMCALFAAANAIAGKKEKTDKTRILKMTVPEDLDYSDAFKTVFDEYAENVEPISVKTTNLGSLFRLTYRLTIKDAEKEKSFIDDLRVRNGNLEISLLKENNENAL